MQFLIFLTYKNFKICFVVLRACLEQKKYTIKLPLRDMGSNFLVWACPANPATAALVESMAQGAILILRNAGVGEGE